MLGVLLVDKPAGRTSHDAVNEIRHRFHTRRVGHAGTLDPLATGLLVVAIGPATRFLQYLPLEPKEYIAEIVFGRSTTTFDAEGEVTSEAAVPTDLAAAVDRVKPRFLGLIRQVPPMYSAVKVGGKALYRYARAGQEVEREPRNVHIGAFDVVSMGPDRITARIECSGGTYIRTLAHDLGQDVGSGAYLANLNRTRVGRFSLEQATPLDAVSPDRVMPLGNALDPMPRIDLSDDQVSDVREGRPIRLDPIPASALVALNEPGNGVFSVARVVGNLLQPECVIPIEAMI
ncbi:MAG TPA: tRNA pseudouridine(55) synthase TruB [Fimbriimonadaceae bacterium]|nr:tRNA pseudouridine(55) synthase TruB [Fimbriimonadaceae bacterium]